MLSLGNIFADEEVRGVLRARAPLPRAAPRRRRSTSSPSRRSTACPARCATRTDELVQAATRGDGYEGEDVTANVRTIARDPEAAARRAATFSRCAARSIWRTRISPRSTRAQQAAGKRIFANPRNAAAGSLRQLDRAHHRGAAAASSSPMPGASSAQPIATTQIGVIEAFAALRPADQSADPALPFGGGDARALPRRSRRSAPTSATTSTASSTRSTTSRCSSGSASSRAARAGRPRTSFPPSSATTIVRGDRDPGRAHRRADAGREAEAGDGRRRRRLQRHAAQRGRDRAQGRARRRHRRRAARGRRDPADARGRRGEAARATASPTCFPTGLPGLRLGGAARDRREDRRRRRRAPLHRPAGLPGAGGRGPEAFLLAQRLRHRRARRQADRAVLQARA